MVAFFNRKKKDTEALPKEVEDYYQSERRERRGMAWVLAIVTRQIKAMNKADIVEMEKVAKKAKNNAAMMLEATGTYNVLPVLLKINPQAKRIVVTTKNRKVIAPTIPAVAIISVNSDEDLSNLTGQRGVLLAVLGLSWV